MALKITGEAADERLMRKVADTPAVLTIAVPTYRDNPSQLIAALKECDGAESTALLIYDDGTNDTAMTSDASTAIQNWPGSATLVTAGKNSGRAHARNRLLAHAETDWILFLDADMLPDACEFLASYQNTIAHTKDPSLIVGGYSLKEVKPKATQKLHAAQAKKSECLSADIRSEEPGRYVFTSNLLVHRDIMQTVFFDDDYTGWGWEDTDWGLRVAGKYPVIHIDNTATHTGLDDTRTLLRKYGSSGENFARLLHQHPEATADMSLTKAARYLTKIPGRPLVRSFARALALSPLPMGTRLFGLKLYRAACYAEHLK